MSHHRQLLQPEISIHSVTDAEGGAKDLYTKRTKKKEVVIKKNLFFLLELGSPQIAKIIGQILDPQLTALPCFLPTLGGAQDGNMSPPPGGNILSRNRDQCIFVNELAVNLPGNSLASVRAIRQQVD